NQTGSCCLRSLISSTSASNAALLSSSIGNRSARGWKSYFLGASRLRMAGMPVSVGVVVVGLVVGGGITASHQPFPGGLLCLHCQAIGLSRRSSQVEAVSLA